MGKKNMRVIVMEDSLILLRMLRQILEKGGFEVEEAPNGRIGLQKAESFHPALAFIDLMMPEVDGFEVLERMRERFPDTKLVVISAQPPQVVEKRVLELGAELYLQKPVREPVLLGIAKKFTGSADEDALEGSDEVFLPAEKDQPYQVQVKSCYICGYDAVNVFLAPEETHEEDWSYGLWPTYHPKGHFHSWDFLKTMVSVCPSCFFASKDSEDFATAREVATFPYRLDAKKILARSIGVRKRMVDNSRDIDLRFSNPNRDIRLVLDSLRLAEKCGNGLVLGDKEGVYSNVGFYSLMHCILNYGVSGDKNTMHSQLREALVMFENQLKVPAMRRRTRARTYYFCIALHMVLGESIRANEMKEELEKFYLTHDPEDASEEERRWNERLVYIWKNGVDMDTARELG